VLATIQAGGTVWSYPNLRGNMTVTTNNTGGRLNGPVTYDPWGQPTSGSQTLNNAAGGNTFAAYGANAKLTDTTLGITVLGARVYQAAEGRFLSVDPLEGGCANNYVYVFGDPLNKNDLTGQFSCTVTINKYPPHANMYVGTANGAVYSGTWSLIGLAIAKDIQKYGGSKAQARFSGGTTGGMAGAMMSFGYAYVTTGKWNWCAALIEGALGAAIGILAA
jgi:RHS repeat-associated protein